MKDAKFMPREAWVRTGTVVSSKNEDTVRHAPNFAGSVLHTPAGSTSQRSFDTAGDHAYTCDVHGALMSGTVHVVSG